MIQLRNTVPGHGVVLGEATQLSSHTEGDQGLLVRHLNRTYGLQESLRDIRQFQQIHQTLSSRGTLCGQTIVKRKEA